LKIAEHWRVSSDLHPNAVRFARLAHIEKSVGIGACRAIRIRIQLSSLASLTLKDRLALARIERSASEYSSVRIEHSKILAQIATLVPSKLSRFKLTEFLAIARGHDDNSEEFGLIFEPRQRLRFLTWLRLQGIVQLRFPSRSEAMGRGTCSILFSDDPASRILPIGGSIRLKRSSKSLKPLPWIAWSDFIALATAYYYSSDSYSYYQCSYSCYY
jgi:hypothetical protein